jgi:hypothetical protein
VSSNPKVPSLITARKLRALAAIGWPSYVLAERMGVSRQLLTRLRLVDRRCKSVFTSTAEKIDALYLELHMIPGPSPTMRRRAAANGWAPPLAWNDIDDPDETPQLGAPVDVAPDENVVRAFVANRPPRWGRMTEADRELLVRELRRLGYTRNAIALATHASHQQVRRWWEKVAG